MFGLKEIDDMVIYRYGWWVIMEEVVAFAAQDVVWWLSQLRIWCGSHRTWVRSQQTLSPGVGAAQSGCLLCLMDEVEECDCLKGQCSPSMDSQVCVEWDWGQKCGRTISHSAGSCGFLHSFIQHTNLGQGRNNQDTWSHRCNITSVSPSPPSFPIFPSIKHGTKPRLFQTLCIQRFAKRVIHFLTSLSCLCI